MKMTKSAEHKLEAIAQEYKESILSKISSVDSDQEITESDIAKIVEDLEDLNFRSSKKLTYLKKKQEMLIRMIVIGFTYLFTGITFYIFSKDFNQNSVIKLSLIVAIISLTIILVAVVVKFYLQIEQNRIPDKRKQEIEFMKKWNEVERFIRMQSSNNKKTNRYSLLDGIKVFSDKFGNNCEENTNDFHYLLNVRNRIVHGNFNSFSESELRVAIEKADKVLSVIKRYLL